MNHGFACAVGLRAAEAKVPPAGLCGQIASGIQRANGGLCGPGVFVGENAAADDLGEGRSRVGPIPGLYFLVLVLYSYKD